MYINKRIRVRGKIEAYKTSSRIYLTSPKDIRVLGPAGKGKVTEKKTAAVAKPSAPRAKKRTTKVKPTQSVARKSPTQSKPVTSRKPRISWKAASKHVGQTVIVEGQIVATRKLDKILFLNFGKNRGRDFAAVVLKKNFGKFKVSPDRKFLNQYVEIQGKISLFKGSPQIVIENPAQIRLLNSKGNSSQLSSSKAGGGLSARRPSPSLSPPLSERKDLPIISWQDAAQHIGEDVIVEGKIRRTILREKFTALNFHNNYRRYLTAVIPSRDSSRYPAAPEIYFRGKEIRVLGKLTEKQGRISLVVRRPGDITVLNQ